MTESLDKILWIYPLHRRCGISDYASCVVAALRGIGCHVIESDPPANGQERRRILEIADSCMAVHVQYEHAFFLHGRKNEFERLARRLKRPLIVTLHEVYEKSPWDFPISEIRSCVPGLAMIKKMLYRFRHPALCWENQLCQERFFASAIQVHNEHQREVLAARGVEPHRIHVIPLGAFSIKPNTLQAKPLSWRMGTFGFVNFSVDYETVLKALSRLPFGWEYKIAGGAKTGEQNSWLDKIKSLAKTLNLESRIHITGYLESAEVESFFRNLDLYIAPFRFKSSSASLLHAISCGLPVVASDIPLVRDMNRRIACMAVYSPGDEKSLAKKIEELAKDESLRQRLSGNAREYAFRYSFAEEAKRLLSLYRQMGEK